ncbi:MAG TPA: FAD-dependent oxidoreductase [Trueperaceae bacterium]
MNRADAIGRLKSRRFDMLVLGGGATGTGIALDAATRGLDVALVEKEDFAAGTSSRSTKLIHGGVRYLEKAVKEFDRGQLDLVRDALKERAVLLRIAPHLSRPLPLLTPLYGLFEIPYYFTGLKIYDLLAGRANLESSRLLGRAEATRRFPMLRKEGLKGGVLYYDGQFDDARMNVSLALTAAQQGATVANHVAASDLLEEGGRLRGAVVKDTLTGESWEIDAKVVVNATGPFCDEIRLLDDPGARRLLSTSSGTHIVLDAHFSPPETGLLIPKTEDGRVLFLLPWLGHTLVGTTDNPAPLSEDPQASEEDIEYILRHLRHYFDLPVGRGDVLSSWSGLRPLVSNDSKKGTSGLVRDHLIEVSESGLLTITGGKWTTYRKMALDAVDRAVRVGRLEPSRGSATETLPLRGAEGFGADGIAQLERAGLDEDVAAHLHRAYGSKATEVATIAAQGYGGRLAAGYPHIEAEVIYGSRVEMACTAEDILHRRTRLAFLNESAAEEARPRVEELLATSSALS